MIVNNITSDGFLDTSDVTDIDTDPSDSETTENETISDFDTEDTNVDILFQGWICTCSIIFISMLCATIVNVIIFQQINLIVLILFCLTLLFCFLAFFLLCYYLKFSIDKIKTVDEISYLVP